MNPSIRSQIIARLDSNLRELLADQTFRNVERKAAPAVLQAVTPCIQYVIGPEVKIEPENQGSIIIEFPADIWVIVDDTRDPYAKADELAAFIQVKIEADLQLIQLANSILYNGDQPFTTESDQPRGGTVLLYTVQYQRKRADPTSVY